MKQQDLGLNLSTRRTRKAEFLDEMELVVPWHELVSLIKKVAPPKAMGRPPFGHETMLRLHFLHQWFGLSDFAMEEALFDAPLYRAFAVLDNTDRLPDRVSILRFRHLLEQHNLAQQILATINATLTDKGLMLRQGTAIDATLIAAPSSTKNSGGERDPEMHQTRKGNQWHFGMKAHVGVDADSGLVHTVTTTAANQHDVKQARELLHGAETDVVADSGYRGVEKREEVRQAHPEVNWHVAMMPSKRRALDKDTPMGAILEKLEQTKARIRAKVEHPFRVIKRSLTHQRQYMRPELASGHSRRQCTVVLAATVVADAAHKKVLSHYRTDARQIKDLMPNRLVCIHLDSCATAFVLTQMPALDPVINLVLGLHFLMCALVPGLIDCTLAAISLRSGRGTLSVARQELGLVVLSQIELMPKGAKLGH